MGSSSNNDNKAAQPRPDRRWYFPKEEILNSPSCRLGLTPEKELSYRQQSASLIQEIGQRLQVGQLVINTGIVYMHRFYMMYPFQKFHRNTMTPACVFLAAKVEEQPRKLEHLLKVTNVVIHGSESGPEPTSEEFVTRASEIMVNENILLQTLGFDVAIDHPHTHVVKCCQLVRATKDLAQTSYFMATNSLHLTTMCLQYKPTVVACLCIYLVCKWSRYEMQRQTEGRDWFYYVDADVTLDLLSSLCNDFLKILDKCPLKVKKLIKNAQNAQARMVASGGGGVIGGPPARSSLGGDQHKQLSMGNTSALSMSGMTRSDGSRSSLNLKEYSDKREKERRERERIALEAAANNPYSFNPQAMRASANLPPQISSSSQHPPYGVPNFKFSTANRNSVHSSHHKHEQPQQNQQQHQHRMVPKHNAPADQHQFFQESKRQSMDSTMTSKTRPSLPPHHQNTVKHEIQPKMEQKPFPKFEQKPNVRSSDVIKSERNLPVKNERNVPQFKQEEVKKEEDTKYPDGGSFIFNNCEKTDFNLGSFMPFTLGDAPPEDIFDTNDSMGHLAPATHHKGLSPGGGELSNTPPLKHSKGDPKGASSMDGRPGQSKSREQMLEEHNKKVAAQKQQQQQLFEQQQQRELLQQKMQQEQAEKQKQMELKKQQQMEQQRQEEIRKKEQEMKRQEQIRLEKERETAKRKELQRKEMELQKQQEMRLLAEKQAQQLKQQQELQKQREEQQAALLRQQQQQQQQQQELLRKQMEIQRQQEIARQKEEEKREMERLHRKKKEEKELLKMQEMQRKSAYDTNSIGEILSTVTGKSNLLTPKASSKRRSKEILETSPLMMNTGILSPGTKPYRPQPDSPSHPSQVALYHRNSGKVVKNLTKQLDEPDQIATPPPPSYPLKRTYSEAMESDTRPDLFGNNFSVGESSKVQPDDSTVANPSKKHKSEHKHHKEKKKHKNKEKDKHKDREHKKEKKHKKNKDKDKERKRSSIPEAEFATPEAPIKLTIKIGNSDTPQVTPSSTGLKMKISKGGIIKKPEDAEFDYNKSKRRKESPDQSKYSKAGLAKTLDYGHHDQPPPPSGSYSRYQ